VALLIVPAKEGPKLRQDFFDEGYQCNSDARHRALEAVAVLAAGMGLTWLLARRARALPRSG
jgi:hypothetical protein